MGIFAVSIKVKNWQHRYLPPEKQGEEIKCKAPVDSWAMELALPTELVSRLKLGRLG